MLKKELTLEELEELEMIENGVFIINSKEKKEEEQIFIVENQDESKEE